MRKALMALLLYLGPGLMGQVGAGEVFAGSWRVRSIATADAFDSARTQFVVLDDGRVGSTVGCNRILGKPEVDGARIAFGPMATTRRACVGPLADLEAKYLAALDAARSWRVKGAVLSLLDASGSPVVTLTKAR